VTFAGWLIGINGVFLSLGGVVTLLVASNTRLMIRHGLAQGAILILGFVLLAVGLIELLLVYALFGGSNVARIVVTVLFGLGLLLNTWPSWWPAGTARSSRGSRAWSRWSCSWASGAHRARRSSSDHRRRSEELRHSPHPVPPRPG
jgi:hypothetical protein